MVTLLLIAGPALAFATAAATATNTTRCSSHASDGGGISSASSAAEATQDTAANNDEPTPVSLESLAQSIRSKLQSLSEREESERRASVLVGQLNSSVYSERERATTELKGLPFLSVEALTPLLKEFKDEPESTQRLNSVIAFHRENSPLKIQRQLLDEVIKKNVPGLANDILDALPLLEQEKSLRRLAIRAVVVTADETNVARFKSVANSPDVELSSDLCVAAFNGLWATDPQSASSLAMRFHDRVTGEFGLDVAKVLVANERPEVVPLLIRLVKADDRLVGRRATRVLSALTGVNLLRAAATQSTPNQSDEATKAAEIPANIAAQGQADQKPGSSAVAIARASAESAEKQHQQRVVAIVARVEQWLAEPGNQLTFQWNPERYSLGRCLVCQYDQNRVIEFDETGSVVWSVAGTSPFACRGMPNGDRYIAYYNSGTIVHYDGQGNLIKNYGGLPQTISGFTIRENGNFLIAAGGLNKIVEVDVGGKQINEFPVAGNATSLEVGPAGTIFVSIYDQNKIIEYDITGKTLNEIAVQGGPFHAQPLESGNLLVAHASRGNEVAEYSPDGQKIFALPEAGPNVFRAHELPDGSIGFAGPKGAISLSRNGDELSKFDYPTKGSTNYAYWY